MRKGIYVVRATGKEVLYLGYSEHLEETMAQMKDGLGCGHYTNPKVQKLWQEFGKGALHFEVLECLSGPLGYDSVKQSLVELQSRWLQRLAWQGKHIELL
ncbi:MAG: hypothetical protein ACRCW2_10910 [Cellulosilyticaceae bacterium]